MSQSAAKAFLAPSDLRPIHPLHAMLLAFALPMFLSAWLSDLAYSSSFHVQWINFAQWLIVGGLVGVGFALLWMLIVLIRDRAARSQRQLIYCGVMLAAFILGFIDALVHAQDAYATMPAGVWLSFFVAMLAFAASWIGFSGLRAGDGK
jgi:uncharacterized membrane protein